MGANEMGISIWNPLIYIYTTTLAYVSVTRNEWWFSYQDETCWGILRGSPILRHITIFTKMISRKEALITFTIVWDMQGFVVMEYHTKAMFHQFDAYHLPIHKKLDLVHRAMSGFVDTKFLPRSPGAVTTPIKILQQTTKILPSWLPDI